jgi:hypothetical protein
MSRYKFYEGVVTELHVLDVGRAIYAGTLAGEARLTSKDT